MTRRIPTSTFGAVQSANPLRDLLDSLAARDFDRLAASLAPYAVARMLLPDGSAEIAGPAAIARKFEGWFGNAADMRVVAGGVEPVGPRWRLQYRVRLSREYGPAAVVEQVAFADVGPAGIYRLDLLCSGFLAEAPGTEGAVHRFDAGDLGCGDGLAQEFRRQLLSVPVGESLAVVVSDPAAREDLPSLARLLGHSVTSTETRDDGRLEITVERIR